MTDRYVAFIDVLGFSDFVRRSDPALIERLYRTFENVAQMALTHGKYILVDRGDGEQVAVPDFSHAAANMMIVSDSIILDSDRADMKGFIDVAVVLQRLLCHAFYVGLPLRAAMTVGPLAVIDRRQKASVSVATQSLVGLALVDAYEFEIQQDWSGGVISDRAVSSYQDIVTANQPNPDLATLEYLIETRFLGRHSIPLKNGSSHQGWCSEWPWGNPDRPSSEMVTKAFEMHGKDPDKAQNRIQNTLTFLAAVRPEP
jgi:hypothetical protein